MARRAGLRTGLFTQKGYVMGIADPSHVDRAELVPARAAIMAPDLVAALRLALRDAGIEEQCMVIVTADHGGIGRNHWESVSEVLTIPWMAIGRGVRKGFAIERPIVAYDTAPTMLRALGLPIPEGWDGRPVVEAFAARPAAPVAARS